MTTMAFVYLMSFVVKAISWVIILVGCLKIIGEEKMVIQGSMFCFRCELV